MKSSFPQTTRCAHVGESDIFVESMSLNFEGFKWSNNSFPSAVSASAFSLFATREAYSLNLSSVLHITFPELASMQWNLLSLPCKNLLWRVY